VLSSEEEFSPCRRRYAPTMWSSFPSMGGEAWSMIYVPFHWDVCLAYCLIHPCLSLEVSLLSEVTRETDETL